MNKYKTLLLNIGLFGINIVAYETYYFFACPFVYILPVDQRVRITDMY